MLVRKWVQHSGFCIQRSGRGCDLWFGGFGYVDMAMTWEVLAPKVGHGTYTRLPPGINSRGAAPPQASGNNE